MVSKLHDKPYLRIATEEAFCPPELLDIYRRICADGVIDDPGFIVQWGYYLKAGGERARFVCDQLVDMGERRLSHMDAAGIDRAIIALTSPGVQVMERADAVAFAAMSNDMLAEDCARHPDRYIGQAAIAPQDPEAAAKELERATRKLGLKGAQIHSHTMNEYMDSEKYYPIFEAAEALDEPIYLHPNTPSKGMYQPFVERGLDGAIFGFGVETGLHMLRLIVSGLFDRYPKLRMIIGHAGEAIPFWLHRLDYMHGANVRSQRYDSVKPLKKKISDYMRENIWITTSGMADPEAIEFCQRKLGVDRVMYAMDYPYNYEPDEVGVTETVNISPDEMKMLFQTNAEQVFKLSPAPAGAAAPSQTVAT
ncbi:MAG: amidohydrolase family protein [Caulobacterales bacterium]|nr:amidohydrolase family protein [Caulobacterales bacterium]